MIRRNLVILNGRACRDAELKVLAGGNSKVCSVRMACNERIKRRGSDEYEDKPMYIDVEMWGQRAEYAADKIKKGDIFSVVGKLEMDEWGEGDKKRQKHKVYVNLDLQVDKYEGRDSSSGGGDTAEETPVAVSNESDLPF